jgi:solute carrier family 25 phosphate transporter 3
VKGWGPTFVGYSLQGLCKFGFYEVRFAYIFYLIYCQLFKHEFTELVGHEYGHKYRDLVYIAASASAEVIAE